jgi:hypothetical protein
MISIRKAAVALAIAALPLSATPAQAHTVAGVVIGTGTITPGLPGCNQQVTFSGQLVVTTNPPSVRAVTFAGASASCEDIVTGSGCGTISGPGISGTVCYNRTGNVVQLSGTVTMDGHPHTLTATCEFVPTSAQPTTSYVLTCQVALS